METTNVPHLSFLLLHRCQQSDSGTMQHIHAASSHPPCGHSFMCWHGDDTLLSTMLGPAVVVASGWGWISVMAVRHGDPESCGGG